MMRYVFQDSITATPEKSWDNWKYGIVTQSVFSARRLNVLVVSVKSSTVTE